MKAKPVGQRFWSKVEKTPTCWLWTASFYPHGYGLFRWGTDSREAPEGAHRASWMLTYGSIPKGLFVCHSCDNKRCVRPDHLFLGTVKDNVQDAVKKGLTLRGADHPRAKLTRDDVVEIRRIVLVGPRGCGREMARRFGVSHSTISEIKSNIKYRLGV